MSEIFNLNTLCRCCHADGQFKSLNTVYQGKNGPEVYETILEDVLGISILPPPLQASYTICDTCVLQLQDAKSFREQVLLCERKFRIYCSNELIHSNQVKEEIKSDDEVDTSYNNEDHSSYVDIHIDEGNIGLKDEQKNVVITLEPQSLKIQTEKLKDDKQEKPTKSTAKVKAPNKLVKTRKKTEKAYLDPIQRKTHIESLIDVSREKDDEFRCKVCSKVFPTRQKAEKHITNTHKLPFSCCEMKYDSYELLLTHMKKHTILCNHCGKEFSQPKSFYFHLNRAMIFKELQCDICKKFYKNRSILIKHFKYHAGTMKRILCHICGHGFNDRTNMVKHLQAVHEKLRPFKCNMCEKCYSTKKTLLWHLKSHEGNNYFCSICGKSYYCKKTLAVHILTHDNKHGCLYCKEIFDSIEEKKTHVLEVHGRRYMYKARPMTCHTCGLVLAGKHSLNRHLNTHHNIKDHECTFCKARFGQRVILNRHIFRKHTEKVFAKDICRFCKRKCSDVKNHEINVHLKPKHQCDMCGKYYANRSTLTRHKARNHFGRNFTCDVCGRIYLKKSSMIKHKLKAHAIKEEIGQKEENNDMKL